MQQFHSNIFLIPEGERSKNYYKTKQSPTNYSQIHCFTCKTIVSSSLNEEIHDALTSEKALGSEILIIKST